MLAITLRKAHDSVNIGIYSRYITNPKFKVFFCTPNISTRVHSSSSNLNLPTQKHVIGYRLRMLAMTLHKTHKLEICAHALKTLHGNVVEHLI